MEHNIQWKTYWERRAERSLSDFEYDRGRSPGGREIELLSEDELLSFIQPEPADTIFDAGCGSGVNILRLHSKVSSIIAMDFTKGSVERARKRVEQIGISNAEVVQGNITDIPLQTGSVDKVLCMSVLQYLTDVEARQSFTEFSRILKAGGILILHVKNISSLYLATLWLAKRTKLLLGMRTKLEHYRSYRWYVRELESLGFEVLAYNSFNLLAIEGMPSPIARFLQKFELKYHSKFPLRLGFLRRHGSDLKLKAQLVR